MIKFVSCNHRLSASDAIKASEWTTHCHHREEDDTESEHVDGLTRIHSSLNNLRSHVTWRSKIGRDLTISLAFHRLGETKVRNLDREIISDKHVLQLDITVDNTLVVHVSEPSNHLQEELLGNWLREA